MTGYRRVRVILYMAAMVIGVSPANAQVSNETAAPGPAVEVTPFVALGSVFSSRIGAAISFAWTQNLDVEAEVGYRQNGMNALGASVNLV